MNPHFTTSAVSQQRLDNFSFLLIAGAILSFTLWDFYASGLRIFDFFGLALIAAYCLINRELIDIDRASFFFITGLFVAAAGFHGILDDPQALKPTVGLVLGVCTAILIVSSPWNGRQLRKLLSSIIIIHASLQLLQLVIYISTGALINYHGWLGIQPRLEWLVFRAAGLYQEPAGYSLMMFSFLTLWRLSGGTSMRLEALALATIMSSVSLWGVGAVAVYLAIFRPKISLMLVPVAGAIVSVSYAAFSDAAAVLALTNRLETLGDDGSANERYGGLLNAGPDILAKWTFWFGSGITNDYLEGGSSGLSFLLAAVGVLGALLFIGTFALRAGRVRAAVALLFLLTAAPIWTSLWWWAWMALLTVRLYESADMARRTA